MTPPVSNKEREDIRERYRKRRQKTEDPEQKAKLDGVDFIRKNHQLETDEKSLKRGQKCIVTYNLEAISKSEEAFLKAIRRNRARATLPYFFRILKNIQMRWMKPGMRTIAASAMDTSRYLKESMKNKNTTITS